MREQNDLTPGDDLPSGGRPKSAFPMLLAFAIDQIQAPACAFFQQAWHAQPAKTYLWKVYLSRRVYQRRLKLPCLEDDKRE